jgi:hypothetical protein
MALRGPNGALCAKFNLAGRCEAKPSRTEAETEDAGSFGHSKIGKFLGEVEPPLSKFTKAAVANIQVDHDPVLHMTRALGIRPRALKI